MGLSATTRLRLRRKAAELTVEAIEATDDDERKRLLTEARALADRLEADEKPTDEVGGSAHSGPAQ
jgi:hypothetical protein